MIVISKPGMIRKYPTYGTKFNIAITATITPAKAMSVTRLFLNGFY